MDWFENADEVIQDLDALRAREAAQKREYTIRSVIGLLLTVIITSTIVFLLWKLLKKHEEFHYLFIALFVLAAAVFWVAGLM